MCRHYSTGIKFKLVAWRFEESNNGRRKNSRCSSRKVKRLGGITHITKRFTTQNKETKIIVNSPWVKEHVLFKDKSKYHAKSDYGKMMSFLTSYTSAGKNKNDDVPDGMAQFALFVQSLTGNKVEIFKRPF